MRRCTLCEKEKGDAEFGVDKRNLDGLAAWCKQCRNEYTRGWRSRNPEKYKNYSRTWNANNPGKAKQKSLIYKFNLTKAAYDEMLRGQADCCAICKRHFSAFKKALAVDHCHESGKIRGLLCVSCNRGLGYLQDSVELLNRAVSYIETSKG